MLLINIVDLTVHRYVYDDIGINLDLVLRKRVTVKVSTMAKDLVRA